MFTSNYSLRELEAHWRPDDVKPGAFHPGRRISERIAEYCTGVKVAGRNLRRTVDTMIRALPSARVEEEL